LAASAKSSGEVTPERIETGIGHLKDSANVAGLAAVEEEVGLGRVGVRLAGALKEFECDECVEEVARGTGVKSETFGELVELLRTLRELGGRGPFRRR
jgi:hypothetical protein